MKTKAMKGISHRILTLALALLMALSTLSGALSVSALADDEEIVEAVRNWRQEAGEKGDLPQDDVSVIAGTPAAVKEG